MIRLLLNSVALLAVILPNTGWTDEAERSDKAAFLVDGETFAGRPAAIDEKWNITFSTAGEKRDVPADDLVHWGARTDPETGPLVLLAGGGTIVADEVRIEDDRLLVRSSLWGEPAGLDPFGTVRLPLSALRGVVLRLPAGPLGRDRLVQRILSAEGAKDRLLLQNGDVLSGTLLGQRTQSSDDVAPGLEPEFLEFDCGGGKIDVPLGKVVAITFDPTLVDAPTPSGVRVLIGFRDGTCITAAKVVSDDQTIEATLATGVTIRSNPGVNVWRELSLLRVLGGRVVYLSDLSPAGYKHVPYLDLPWSYSTDRSVGGGRLRAKDVVYTKGLGMHSTSRLSYRLRGPYRRLEAELAVDDSAGGLGSVTFRVFVADDAGEWKPAYGSPVVRGGDAPLSMSVDLSGAKHIALIVDFADRGDVLDHADWLSARLIK